MSCCEAGVPLGFFFTGRELLCPEAPNATDSTTIPTRQNLTIAPLLLKADSADKSATKSTDKLDIKTTAASKSTSCSHGRTPFFGDGIYFARAISLRAGNTFTSFGIIKT